MIAVFTAGMLTGNASMPGYLWIITGLCVWVGSLVFAAFGLFIGYLLPAENVIQFLGIAMMLLAFGGGLFIPLSQYPHVLQTVAEFTPLYGLNQLVHAPLLGSSKGGRYRIEVEVHARDDQRFAGRDGVDAARGARQGGVRSRRPYWPGWRARLRLDPRA